MFAQYKDVVTHLGSYSKNIFRKGYVGWLFRHMKTWNRFSWFLIVVNFIIQVILAWQGFASVSLAKTIFSFLGANLSVMTVVGISNKAPIQGWFGATSAICIATAGLLSHNYADATLQLGYLIFLDLFCILSPSWNDNVQVHKMKSAIEWIKYIVFFFAIWGLAYFLYGFVNDPRVFLDSAVLAISVTGSLMEFNLLREQYFVWTLSSIITIGLWIQTAMHGDGNYALVASYSIFFLNDLWAFFSVKGWFRGENRKEANKLASQDN